MLTKKEHDLLRPWLEGEEPEPNGEWAMRCPYHDDQRRSASLNVNTKEWNCQGCDEGGSVTWMVRDHENWRDPGHHSMNGTKSSGKPEEAISEAMVEGWAEALVSNKEKLSALKTKRGLTTATIKKYQIGWDSSNKCYTIPIRDLHGDLCNVRRYDITVGPDSERRKIWSVGGMGTPTIFPTDQLDYQAILICEGEFDALVAIQAGIPAVTRTGTADHWKREWGELFRGKRVFICHDMDTKGQQANAKVVAALRGKTRSTTVIELPYPVEAKHGKDLTDFFIEDGNTKEDFNRLSRKAPVQRTAAEAAESTEVEMVNVSVIDSFDSKLSGKPLAMQVTVTGKRVPPYTVPKTVELTCDLEGKSKCKSCSMAGTGHMRYEFPPDSPDILGMIGVTTINLEKCIKNALEINTTCPRPSFSSVDKRTVEEIYVRPSIENAPNGDQDFTHRKVISTVSHDVMANQTVDLIGTTLPSPVNQTNEFQAWIVKKPTNTLQSFKLTPEIREALEQFQDDGDPMVKLRDIADDLANHVTKIYDRTTMHIFMDLVFHSVRRFNFGDKLNEKAWLDALIVGDTRTGKSEAASQLIGHYGMGEMISCESASYAGVVGGLDRTPDGQWVIKWGVIPVNHMRAVVLDEVSGLEPHEISRMTNIRTEGEVIMEKIESGRALAETRLLWLANPRDSKMSEYTYGVNSIQKLVGNREDIARYDIAMGVFSEDVGSNIINRMRDAPPDQRYDQESMKDLLRWAWTLKPEQIMFTAGAVNTGLDLAIELGDDYSNDPPLVEKANIVLKLARVAAAMAARTFSADSRGRCIVKPKHMIAARQFIDEVYGAKLFGYQTLSRQRSTDRQEAMAHMDEITEYIRERPALLRFLKHTPVFDRSQLEAIMNLTRDVSGAMINNLWDMKAVSMSGNSLKLEPDVLARVREIEL